MFLPVPLGQPFHFFFSLCTSFFFSLNFSSNWFSNLSLTGIWNFLMFTTIRGGVYCESLHWSREICRHRCQRLRHYLWWERGHRRETSEGFINQYKQIWGRPGDYWQLQPEVAHSDLSQNFMLVLVINFYETTTLNLEFLKSLSWSHLEFQTAEGGVIL